MDGTKVFQPNKPNVIHEVIDGEAVIVNLKDGTYYSTDKVGAELWSCIDKELSVDQMIEHLQARYMGSRETIIQAVNQFIAQLESEKLVVRGNGQHTSDEKFNGSVQMKNGNGEMTGQKVPFEEPKIEKYSDMADLLLLDPIHDVEEEGWPHANAKKDEV